MNKIIIAHFDGSCSNPKNGGDIGIGYHAEELGKPQGSLFKVSKGGFVGTNNEAEYIALLHLLRRLSKQAPNTDVIVRGDSQIVVEQMNGDKRTNNHSLSELQKQVKSLEKYFANIRYEHVPREKNSLADNLSKKSIEHTLRDYYNYKF